MVMLTLFLRFIFRTETKLYFNKSNTKFEVYLNIS